MLNYKLDSTKYINCECIYFERGYVVRAKIANIHVEKFKDNNLYKFELQKLCIYGEENCLTKENEKGHVSSLFCKEIDGNIQASGYESWCLVLNTETLSKIDMEFTLLRQNAVEYAPHSDDYYLICRDTVYGQPRRRTYKNDD